MKPIYYKQSDHRWGKLLFTSHNDRTQTIGSSGCGVTCAAMVLATLLNDATIKPDYTAKLCVDNGYRTFNSGTDFKFFPWIAQKFSLKLKESFSTDEVVQALKNGALVICSMTKGYFTQSGHFILAYDVKDGNILVNDPAHPERTQGSIGLFKRECQKYFIFTKEEKPMNEFEENIKVLKDNGIIDADSQHGPDEPVTWSMLAKVSANILKK